MLPMDTVLNMIYNVQAFRIHVALDATSTAATSWPITFFIKEQNTGSSLSFSVPTQPEGYVLFLSLIIVVTIANNYF